MHQTFYIDIDEEITSIVDRLRSAQSGGLGEVVIVVPKRALLIQSIVNLRLLKKEADNMGVSLSIVTQDNLGKVLIEKAGIMCRDRLEEGENETIIGETGNKIGENYFGNSEYKGMNPGFSDQNSEKLDKIGSDNYFSSNANGKEEEKRKIKENRDISSKTALPSAEMSPMSGEKILNKELVSGVSEDMKRRRAASNMDMVSPSSSGKAGSSGEQEIGRGGYFMPNAGMPGVSGMERAASPMPPDPYRSGSGDKKVDSFFQHPSYPDYQQKKENSEKPESPGKMKKFLLFILIIFVLGVLGAAAYLFVPKALVLVTMKSSEQSKNIEIKGDVGAGSVDYENRTVPVKLFAETVEASETVSSTGSKSASSKKARGTITIYNEFSSASQPLVATTRFESEGGKIFRLEKGVTVPGTTTEGGEVKPGAIEAEVVADGAGSEYNIEAGKFTIPGFKNNGNDKYNKIYAKSTKAMAGGGTSGDSSESKYITESDINEAKSKLSGELKAAARSKIQNSAGAGAVVLDDAINLEETAYSFSNSVGEAVDKFEIKGQAKASALFFSEADLKSILSKAIAESQDGKASIDGSLTLDYGEVSADFKAGTVVVSVHGKNKTGVNFDTETLKEGILGKTNEELEAYLLAYPGIEKADVTYWPSFMNQKIPAYAKRVEVTVETD